MKKSRNLGMAVARCLAMLLVLWGGVKTASAQTRESAEDFYAVYTPGTSGGTLTFKKCTPAAGDGNTYYTIADNQYSAARASVETVVFDDSFKAYAPTTCKSMFAEFGNLKSVNKLENLNTANVTDMSHMFSGCEKLEALDLSHFNTAAVTDMSYMFNRCGSLSSLDLSHFDTRKVTTMKAMFSMYNEDHPEKECGSKLTSLDLSAFDTSAVTDISFMFSLIRTLKSVNLSSFNTSKVTTLKGMFSNCEALETVDLTNFDTSRVQDMDNMFGYCAFLNKIYVGDSFTTQQDGLTGTDMFKGCTTLLGKDPAVCDYTLANFKTGVCKTYCEINGEKKEMQGDNIQSYIADLTLEDGKDFVTGIALKAGHVTYTRTMKNQWGTLCLPFAINTADVAGCDFYTMVGIGGDVLTVRKTTGTIAAGQPVAICRTADDTRLTFAATDADIVTAPVAGDNGNDRFVGTFAAVQLHDYCYNIADNKFWLVGEVATGGKTVWAAGFRSYILPQNNTTAQARPAMLAIGGDATAIGNAAADPTDLLNAAASGKAEVYDAAGHRTSRVQQGLNIIRMGGKTFKVCIK